MSNLRKFICFWICPPKPPTDETSTIPLERVESEVQRYEKSNKVFVDGLEDIKREAAESGQLPIDVFMARLTRR